MLEVGTVDFARSRFVRADGAVLALSHREAQVLATLADARNETVSRDELMARVFGYSADATSRAADTCIARLRRKLELTPDAPRALFTAHGVGYRLMVPGAPEELPKAAPVRAPGVRLLLDDGEVDLGAGLVQRSGERVSLTEQERVILRLLTAQEGRAVEARELARSARLASEGALRNALHRLRRKLEANPTSPRHLLSAPGGLLRLECRICRPAQASEHLSALVSLTDYVVAVLGMPDCVAYALHGGNKLTQVAASGPKRGSNGAVRKPMTQAFGEGIVGAAALLGDPISCHDAGNDPRYLVDLEHAGSELAVPVALRGRLVGVIDLEHPERGAFSAAHVCTLRSLAAIAAPAFAGLERAHDH
jgi:DNA-binding response OmpR family regulator